MEVFKGAVIFLILLFIGVYTFIFTQSTSSPTPIPTKQYSSPIGPTREPPYQLESKSLLEETN